MRCWCSRSGVGAPLTTLNRPADLMGKRDPLALSSPRVLFFQTAHSLRAAISSGELHARCIRVPPRCQYCSTFVSVRRGFGYAHRVANTRDPASLLNQHDAFFEEPLPAPSDYQSLALGVCNSRIVLDLGLQMVFPDFHVGFTVWGLISTAGSTVRVAINDASVPIKPMSASAKGS